MFGADGSNPFGPEFGDSGADAQACTNLCLKEVSCSGGGTTSISGTVYDPAGKTPLYNVAVYVPNAPLSQIVHGATCDQCGSTLSGDPVVATLTDASGQFTLENVPVAPDLPLVFQVGKWRRRINIPNVTACADNPIADPNQTRLAAKPGETSPDDDIPFIALTTGGADPFECLPLKIGVDPGQFTNQGAGGRVNLFQGVGGSTLAGGSPPAAGFWASETTLKSYDIVMMGCEGDTHPEEKPPAALQAMFDYGNAGGRVFGTHYHYYWIESGLAPWPTTATFSHHDTSSHAAERLERAHRTELPESPGVRAVDAQRGRLHDARPVPAQLLAVGRVDRQHAAHERLPRSGGCIRTTNRRRSAKCCSVQHPREPPAHPAMRQGGLLGSSRGVRRSNRRHLPRQLPDEDPEPAGEGARVSAIRSVVLHSERQRASRAAGALTTRRSFLLGTTLLACSFDPPAAPVLEAASKRIADIEGEIGGRIGVCALETGTGGRIAHRARERFAMCSTFKWMLVAHVHARADRGLIEVDDSVAAQCDAAIVDSDNYRSQRAAQARRVGLLRSPSGFGPSATTRLASTATSLRPERRTGPAIHGTRRRPRPWSGR